MRLFVTDVDGTLVLDDREPALPVALAAFLERFVGAGGRWVIATGRDLSDVEDLLPALGVDVRPHALVVNDGQIHVGDAGYRAWGEWNQARQQRREILFARFQRRLAEFREACVADGAAVWRPVDGPWGLQATEEQLDRLANRFERAFSDVPALVFARNSTWATPAPRGDNKGASVRALAGRWGIPAEETVVAGDDLNDLSMMDLTISTRWIAPANAVDRVRRHVSGTGFLARRTGAEGVWEGVAGVGTLD